MAVGRWRRAHANDAYFRVMHGFIGAGGGFEQAAGYNYALYFISGLMVLAAIITIFFTRETTGWFLKYDKALVSKSSCNMGL